ncbi:hypothetical protein EGW08_014128 [Elysia chlorotica]|uniref:Uncharacterized protein n=1 Tax=Elysia chlorotica TaxID=188477 RepID=A0A3S1B289_ELYCH|nr:hypothetical protein EGW08_014128 [Elysia chlorotica]
MAIFHARSSAGLVKCGLLLIAVSICWILMVTYMHVSSLSAETEGTSVRSSRGRQHGHSGQASSRVRAKSVHGRGHEPLDRDQPASHAAQSLPVFVLEEHHEAVRYWMWALQAGRLPRRSGNTLIHIDAHSDLATPPVDQEFPMFRWPPFVEVAPNRPTHALQIHIDAHSDLATPPVDQEFPMFRWPPFMEVARLMQRNDMFIVSAALTGLFSRIVWIWPTWDRTAILETLHGEATTWNVTVGSWQRPVAPSPGPWSGSTRPRARVVTEEDLCICLQPLNPTAYWLDNALGTYCVRFNSTDDADWPPETTEACPASVSLKAEIYSEEAFLRQAHPGGLFHRVSPQDGFVLDIDEDFYGCEPVAQSLYDVGLQESLLRMLSFWVKKIFCGASAEHEHVSDFLFHTLTQFIKKNKYLCSKMAHASLPDSSKILKNRCLISANRYLTRKLKQKLKSLHTPFVDSVFCPFENEAFYKYLLYQLLRLLSSLTNAQLDSVAEVGICFKTSLSTFEDGEVGHFRLCDGYNRPNYTAVTFYSPDLEDIEARGDRLHRIVGQMGVAPNLVTVCRSMRDGYTPRAHFRQIEASVLNILQARYNKGDTFLQLMYDRDLLGGKSGWWHRHKMP